MNKFETDNIDLFYIGTVYDEEYYLDLGDEDIRGWTFMGLRPENEENLRKYARETEPEDILGLSRDDFNCISNWFDFDKFADDMENDWQERHDIQAEREKDGEILYLGSGSGQEIFGYFKKHKIKTYEDYTNHFKEIGLKKETFLSMIKLIEKGIKKHSLDMTEKEKTEEKEAIVKILKK